MAGTPRGLQKIQPRWRFPTVRPGIRIRPAV